MIELPEAAVLAAQIRETLAGRRISRAVAAGSPHKFAWFYGDPNLYDDRLAGKILTGAVSRGGLVEIEAEDQVILLGDGVNLRYHERQSERPVKHQLLIEFDDGTALSCSVQMYGGLWCFPSGSYDNPYYLTAKGKPSPLTDSFDRAYFTRLIEDANSENLSAKGMLATGQRIPGLGNGVLQDILFVAGIHPRKRLQDFTAGDADRVYAAVRESLREMVQAGGRDTEKDLFGQAGGYRTVLSKRTVNMPCPRCGQTIRKEAYMGGSIYYCLNCQTRP